MQLKIFTLAGAAALALAACTVKEKPTQDDTAGAATTGGVTREEAKVEPESPPVTPMPAPQVTPTQPSPAGSPGAMSSVQVHGRILTVAMRQAARRGGEESVHMG